MTKYGSPIKDVRVAGRLLMDRPVWLNPVGSDEEPQVDGKILGRVMGQALRA